MVQASYRIPEQISRGDHSYLNCKSGSDTKPENDADAAVLYRIEVTFSDKYLQLYYNYPDDSSDNEYVDIVALSPAFGCLAINVSGLKLSDITSINGPDWAIRGQSQSIRPVTTAGNSQVAVRGMFEKLPELRDENRQSIIPTKGFLALPFIERDDWVSKFGEPESSLIFKGTIRDRDKLRDKVGAGEDLPEIDVRNALATLRFSDVISGGQLNVNSELSTKRDYIDFVNRRLKILTEKQLMIGLQTPDSPQRIRGIAGSGKTVVMALKAAKLHKENPDAKIAVTFRNHGLRQTHRELITRFYNTLTDGDDPDWDNLSILHGWGGASTGPGMYYVVASKVSQELGHGPYSSTEARHRFGRYTTINQRLNRSCKEICELDSVPTLFDTILIDEAQDLPKYFYQMCWRICEPPKRIYWAYDEAQNLANLEARSTTELFGEDECGDPRVTLPGNLPGGIQSSHVMRKAFRTPRSVLMTAHAFGMGLYREGPVIQTITNERGWDSIGYEIENGDFEQEGHTIVARRPLENSPHPLWDYQKPEEMVNITWRPTWEEEIDWVVDDIVDMVENEGVLPEEIMVTHLWPYEDRTERINYFLRRLEEEASRLSDHESIIHNVSDEVNRKASRANFRQDGKISFSGVYYARGNEAEVVYVMGIEYTGEEISRERFSDEAWRRKHVDARNKAFVLLTRSKGWCRISGTEPTSKIAKELRQVTSDTLADEPKLEFQVPPRDSPFKDLDPPEFDSNS